MAEIKVSVIIPVYNAEKHLRENLQSVQNQTLKEIEIICVDDGSSDGSLDIIKEFAEEDDRFIVATQTNGGAGKARNTGLSIAQGKYLSFLDADDFFETTMLEKAYQKACETDSDFVVFKSDQYDEDSGKYKFVDWVIREKELPPYRPMYFRTFTDNVFKVFVGWAWDKLFKREFVLKHGLTFQEIRTSNDMRFVFSAIVLAKRIDIVDEIMVHQRRNQSSSLSNTREKSWNCFKMALDALKDNLKQYGLYDELEQDYINYALHFSLWNINTISGEKRRELFDKLKDEWFDEMEITAHGRDYFYLKYEYDQYEKIMQLSYDKWEKS